ncbi:MAG: PepSY-like domain-containing protein [Mariniphaga sp.]
MGKVFLTLIIIVFISNAFAITPPENVSKAFLAKFKTATNVKWGKEGAKEWEATFSYEGDKLSANFAADGKWLETELQIPISGLPKPVNEAIKSQYPGWTITEADKTETLKHGTIYEADLKKGGAKKEVAFKEDGTVVVE